MNEEEIDFLTPFKKSLTANESTEALLLEIVVDDVLAGYYPMGMALRDIARKRLYVGAFKDYLLERFEMKDDKAYHIIRSALVAENLKIRGLPVPAKKDQAHAMNGLSHDDQEIVWRKVLDITQHPVGRIVREVREELFPKKTQATPTDDEPAEAADDDLDGIDANISEPETTVPQIYVPPSVATKTKGKVVQKGTIVAPSNPTVATGQENLDLTTAHKLPAELGLLVAGIERMETEATELERAINDLRTKKYPLEETGLGERIEKISMRVEVVCYFFD